MVEKLLKNENPFFRSFKNHSHKILKLKGTLILKFSAQESYTDYLTEVRVTTLKHD